VFVDYACHFGAAFNCRAGGWSFYRGNPGGHADPRNDPDVYTENTRGGGIVLLAFALDDYENDGLYHKSFQPDTGGGALTMDVTALTTHQIQLFLLIFARTVTLIAFLPIFGSQSIPLQLKAGLAFFISIILYPSVLQQHGMPVFPATTGLFVFMIIKELFVGIIIGFVASLLFTIVQFAGYLVDVLTGFSFVELIDPFSDTSVSIFGQFNVLVFTILFLLLNGHYFMLLAIQKSFEVIPMLGVHINTGSLTSFMIHAVGNIFSLGFKFSAPIFVTLMLTQVALAVVARTVPQINVFFVGIPLNIGIALGVMIIALPEVARMFKEMVDLMMQDIWRLIYLMA
jgi:flagellar biosynthetic protein FliR